MNATDWLLQSFVEDSDEVVVLRVIEPGSSAHNAWRASMEEARDEAEKVLYNLMAKNGERKHVSRHSWLGRAVFTLEDGPSAGRTCPDSPSCCRSHSLSSSPSAR